MTDLTREEIRKMEEERRVAHKAALELDHGLVGHPKADLLYEIAWSLGHSSGYNEVKNYYDELAPLLF